METLRTLEIPAASSSVFAWIDDLGRYPSWMPLVHSVELDEPPAAPPAGSADDAPSSIRPAWNVELRATVGPFARSKRLRMVRTSHRFPAVERPGLVVFERVEIDGRSHAPWTLRGEVTTLADGRSGERCELAMQLSYGGRLWTGGVLERVLDDQVRRGGHALISLVT